MFYAEQVEKSVEIRRHNGRCDYGPWMAADEITSRDVVEAVIDEIMECTCRDNRGERGLSTNTEESGRVEVGGEIFLYRQ